MRRCFVDGHVHIGRSGGRPVKIAAAPSLTLENILYEAAFRKGLDIVGVTDAVTGPVRVEIDRLAERGELYETPGGGLLYHGRTLLLPGAEVEVQGPSGGAAHFGVFVPTRIALLELYRWLSARQKNPDLSSQRLRGEGAQALADAAAELGGIFVVNHAFTPHKGLYGNCVDRMGEMVDPSSVSAVELGLSADTSMADRISELSRMTFVTNSDAHSLPKIAREYHIARLGELSFAAYRRALLRQGPDRVAANVGLVPELGKYHQSVCAACGQSHPADTRVCPSCGSGRMTVGVADRLDQVADRTEPQSPEFRPPYLHQVPLEFLPGLGPAARDRLLDAFGTEMAVLHDAPLGELEQTVGVKLADWIDRSRRGLLKISAGGGGRYGRVLSADSGARRS